MSILSKFDTETISEHGAWLHLVVPGSEELAYADAEKTKPLRIKTKGPDSKTWVEFVRASTRKEGKDKRSYDEVAREDAQLLARMTLDWENMPVGPKDEIVPFDRDVAVSVYIKYKDIRKQLLSHILDQQNFTQAQLTA